MIIHRLPIPRGRLCSQCGQPVGRSGVVCQPSNMIAQRRQLHWLFCLACVEAMAAAVEDGTVERRPDAAALREVC